MGAIRPANVGLATGPILNQPGRIGLFRGPVFQVFKKGFTRAGIVHCFDPLVLFYVPERRVQTSCLLRCLLPGHHREDTPAWQQHNAQNS